MVQIATQMIYSLAADHYHVCMRAAAMLPVNLPDAANLLPQEGRECRHAQLLKYFGDNTIASKPGGRCADRCDNCLRGNKPRWAYAPPQCLAARYIQPYHWLRVLVP